jgi:hypothetical protein
MPKFAKIARRTVRRHKPIQGRKEMTAQQEAFEERAAIIQFSSGLPSLTREQAEKIAAEQMGLTNDEAEFLMGAKNNERA